MDQDELLNPVSTALITIETLVETVVEDVIDSFVLAMRAEEVPELSIDQIVATVTDYVSNTFF